MSKDFELPKWATDHEVIYEEHEVSEEKTHMDSMLEQQTNQTFKEGEVFSGEILELSDDYVVIDIGYKQEGLVSAKELKNFDGTFKVEKGDKIDVYLEKLESPLGNLILSRDKAEIIKAWDKISSACDEGVPVTGTVLAKVKGGFSVDIGVKAFLPGSQVDLRPTRNLDKYVGVAMEFKVIKFNKKRGNIVLSRKALLQEEIGKLRDETLSAIQEGMIVKGIVKNITDYGAFVDLGGVDGLLHVTDISWGRVKHPEEVINVGDELNVKVMKFDPEKERVSLGLKQTMENPWETIEDTYIIGNKVKGKVVSIKEYGVFLELEDGGLEGLIHISELSWNQKLKHPSEVVELDDQLECQVLEIDKENQRISLGLKQLQDNPLNVITDKYSVGTVLTGKVKSITNFGIFVDIGEEVDCLVHISDITWTTKDPDLNELYTVGDEVQAKLTSIDKDNQRVALSIKQLQPDPWSSIGTEFQTANIVEVKVVRLTDFGAFVELKEGVEGLIHVSELSQERVQKPEDVVTVGQMVKAVIISVDKEAKKIGLSIKSVDEVIERKNAQEYNKQDVPEVQSAFAEKLKGINIDND